MLLLEQEALTRGANRMQEGGSAVQDLPTASDGGIGPEVMVQGLQKHLTHCTRCLGDLQTRKQIPQMTVCATSTVTAQQCGRARQPCSRARVLRRAAFLQTAG